MITVTTRQSAVIDKIIIIFIPVIFIVIVAELLIEKTQLLGVTE